MAAFVALVLSFAAAASAVSLTTPTSCVDSYSPDTNYFEMPYRLSLPSENITQGFVHIEFADQFTVDYYYSYKHVKNIKSGEEFILYQCGTPMPTVKVSSATKYFEIPISSIATIETVSITFLEALGLRSAFKWLDGMYVTSPCVQKMLEDGSIEAASPAVMNGTKNDGWYMGWKNTTAHEEQMKQVDMLLVDSYTSSILLESYTSNVPDTNPKNINFDAATDPGMLARAEWVKFLSLFFNREKEANEYFDEVKARYDCYSASAKAKSGGNKPVIAFVGNLDGVSASYTVDNSSYKIDLIEAAGGVPLPESLRQKYSDHAAFLAAVSTVDIVIDETFVMAPSNYTYSSFMTAFKLDASANSNLGFVQNQAVLRYDNRLSTYGYDWFESAIAQPDVVLRDLVSYIHPDLLVASENGISEPNYFRRISQASNMVPVMITSSMCANPDLTLVPPTYTCSTPNGALATKGSLAFAAIISTLIAAFVF